MKLGKHNVRQMLREIDVHQWRDWKRYMLLAPFDETRADLRAASICQSIVNMARSLEKHPQPFPLDVFLLKFGDATSSVEKKPDAKPQTADQIERIVRDWVMGSNVIDAEGGHRGS